MKKIYALYFNEQKLEMKITCEKHWENQRTFLENNPNDVCYYNPTNFLSFSRSALIKKAREIKSIWLQKQYENISKIANIEIK